MITGYFGSRTFEVSRSKIYTPDAISVSESLSIDAQENDGGKPSSYIKGIGLSTVKFSLLLDCRFVDVSADLEWWHKTLRAKKPYVLKVGQFTPGTGKYLLKSVEVSGIVIAGDGVYRKAILGLSFEEYVRAGSAEEVQNAASGSNQLSADAIKAIEAAVAPSANKRLTGALEWN